MVVRISGWYGGGGEWGCMRELGRIKLSCEIKESRAEVSR